MKNPLTKLQSEVYAFDHNYKPRLTILEGSIRTGKTFLNNLLFAKHVESMRGRGRQFIVTGYTISSLWRNVLEDLSALKESIDGQPIVMSSKNEFELFGNKICCFGTDKSNSWKPMKGMTAHGWYANEVTESHWNSITQAFKRCSGRGARYFWDCNPSHPNHPVKTMFIDKSGAKTADGRFAVKSWHFALDDNSFLDDDYIESIKRSIPRDSVDYNRDILGLWVGAGGLVYSDNWRAVEAEPDRYLNHFYGLDFGFSESKTALVEIWKISENEYYVKELVYKTHLTTPELIGLMKEAGVGGRIYADDSASGLIQEIRNAGFDCVRAHKGSVVEGIKHVQGCTLNVVLPSQNLLSEIQSYEWKKTADGLSKDEPVKINDHLMDAMRYGIWRNVGKISTINTELIGAFEY